MSRPCEARQLQPFGRRGVSGCAGTEQPKSRRADWRPSDLWRDRTKCGNPTQSRFTTPEQFGKIILRANPDGSAITLSDVARVELGAQNYLFDSELNGKPVAGLAVQMTPGANALATAEAVKTRMAQLAETFPPDISWSVPFDSTLFISY